MTTKETKQQLLDYLQNYVNDRKLAEHNFAALISKGAVYAIKQQTELLVKKNTLYDLAKDFIDVLKSNKNETQIEYFFRHWLDNVIKWRRSFTWKFSYGKQPLEDIIANIELETRYNAICKRQKGAMYHDIEQILTEYFESKDGEK